MNNLIGILTLTIFIFKSTFSQINPYLEFEKPALNDTAPTWAQYMYSNPIDVYKLDSAYEAYYKINPYKKNHYIRYYRRWRRWLGPHLSLDGIVKDWSASQWEKIIHSEEQFHNSYINTNRNINQHPIPNWKDLGPRSTQWIANDNALDTFCPWQANIYAFEISKSNPSILYCITETGSLFRSSDKGKNWILKGQNYNLGSEAIAINPIDQNTILVGVNSMIRKSTDAGNTFNIVFSNNNLGVTDIRYSPTDPNIILAASTTGLWRSSNGGNNWVNILTDECLDIEFSPGNSSIVYVLKKNKTTNFFECWKSINSGTSFTSKTNGWPTGLTNGVGRLAICPAAPNNVYAVLLTSDRPRILVSNDYAESWTITAEGETTNFGMDNWQGFYDLDLAVNSKNANEIIVGTASAFKSSDGGFTFTNIGGYGGKFNLHPDVQVMRNNGDDTYICTDGGINYSNDFFNKNYAYRTFGISSTDMWGFGSGWNEDVFVGGRYHNGNTVWHENFSPQVYLRMGGAESPTGYVNPINNKQVYFSDIGSYILGNTKNDKVVSQSISMWPNESYYTMEYSEMEFHPMYSKTYFIGNGGSIYKTENNGISFVKLFAVPDPNAVVQHIEISRMNPDLIFFTTRSNSPAEGKIWKTEDGGLNWKETSPIPVSSAQRRVMDMAINEDNEIYVALRTGANGNNVFRSLDAGLSWSNWSGSELNDIALQSIKYQLGSEKGTVYLAGSSGRIFYKDRTMSKWEIYNSNLPFNHNSTQMRPFYRDQKLRSAGSNGIWEIDFVEPSKPLAQANVDKKSSACERDTFYFDDYSVFPYDGSQKWEWEFPNAQYVSNKNIRNPKVVFGSVGEFDVSLKISNSTLSSSRIFPKMVRVEPSECNLDPHPGNALVMNGKKQVIGLPAISKLKDAKGITVMCWIKIFAKQEWFTQIISNWGSASSFGFGFAFQGYVPTTNLTFSWKDVAYQLTTSHEVPINQWTHVALTVDSTKATVYMDGKAWVLNKNLLIDLDKTGFTIGNGVPGQGGTFNGEMDELKMYNKALSQNEIREQMHLIPDTLDVALVLYYQFNEKSPSIIYDKSGISHGENGNSPLQKSTVAVGPGQSDRFNVNAIGNYNLNNTTTSLEFANSANPILPNGEMVMYRIHHPVDTIEQSVQKISKDYFVLRNWGSNSTFNGLKNININNTGLASSNSSLKIRTEPFAEGLKWTTASLPGQLNSSKIDGNTLFPNNNLIKFASQWIILGDPIITVNNETFSDKWVLQPNPASEKLLLEKIHYDFKELSLKLYDTKGKIILTKTFVDKCNLDINQLSTGVYFIQIIDKENTAGTLRFIKK
ncbi:MAG: LamG-like jellyroll fold domain-containing protein [Saprospiraceae bacterium]